MAKKKIMLYVFHQEEYLKDLADLEWKWKKCYLGPGKNIVKKIEGEAAHETFAICFPFNFLFLFTYF